MSTFNGEIDIEGISVDHFENIDQKCYFLSHCHTDHMSGLSLLTTKSPIYMSALSALFIRKKCPQLKDNIKILEYNVATYIEMEHKGSTGFTVTALSAGHCAGACMLLFQIEGCDILYTGDFRISVKNALRLKILEEIRANENSVIYLDSTFLKTSFPNFPSQTESVTKILEIVEAFLKQSKNHKVNLKVPARYGYEYLLMELSKSLNEKIFIHEPDVYEQYSLISCLASCVTTDEDARIFLKPTYLKINSDEQTNFLNIQLSAMFWTHWKGGSFVMKTAPKSYRVCYATHSSYNEIRDFLLHLKPKKVHLNVLPKEDKEKLKMLHQVKLIQQEYLPNELEHSDKTCKVQTKFTFKRIRSFSIRQQGKASKRVSR